MRLATYRVGDQDRAAVETEGGPVDAGSLLDSGPVGLKELLTTDRLADLAAADAGSGEGLPEGARLRPPIPNPDKIVCIGLNYRSHAAEAGLDPPELPPIFAKYRNALVAAGEDVDLPEASEKVDYEAEVAFVVGRRAKDVSASDALDHVAGYMLLNDLSARDLQFATPQWMPGKVFDGAAPCGPALVTPDEAGEHDRISFQLGLNGEIMQDGETSDLIFSVPELVAQLSRWMTLEPGDIVATGTPSGVGSVRDPRVWLRPGDEIVISSPTLGRLETRLAG